VRRLVLIATIALSLPAILASAAFAQVRSGTQTNTQPAENGGGPSTTIASVSAQYAFDTGQFSLSVTFQAPVQAADSASIIAYFNSDASGKCTQTLDATNVYTTTDPSNSFSDFFPPSGKLNMSSFKTTSSDGRTVTVSGGDPSMKSVDYRCVTVRVDRIQGQTVTELSVLTPPLYFAGYGPPPPMCQNVSTTTGSGAATTVQLSCTASTGGMLSYAVDAEPSHGTLGAVNQATGRVMYMPASGFTGQDSFTYHATNSNGSAATATVTISVTAPPSIKRVVKCVVPSLKHKTLAGARRALQKAHCSLGHVRQPRHHHRTLHVSSQRPKPRTQLRAGSKVAVALA
jgi:hypothetical protein